jgi:hypothetical protein
MLRLADGPDEVHKMVLARRELNRWAKRAEAEAAGELDPKHARRRSERKRAGLVHGPRSQVKRTGLCPVLFVRIMGWFNNPIGFARH